jgi:predicted MFS family arabinose efflux permease
MSAAAAEEQLSGWAAFRRVTGDPRYRAYMLAATTSMAGQWMQRIALGWLLWEQTHSGAWLGALAVCSLAPGLVFGPIGGVLTDRKDRRFLVLTGEIVLLCQAVVLGAVASLGFATPVLMLGLVAFAGAVSALQESSRSLLVREVTPADCLPTGMSLNAVAVNVTRFLGPALAGPLIAWVGPGPVFWVNAASSVIFVVTVAGMRGLGSTAGRQRGGDAADVWAGFKVAGAHPTITPVLIVFAFTALLIRPLYELLPAFAEHILKGGVQEFSRLVMSVGVGAMAGGAVLTWVAPRRPAWMFMAASFGACVAVSILPATSSPLAATAACLFLGFCMGINAAASQLVVIVDAPAFASGRILSLWGTIIRGGPALGALAMGGSFDLLGYRWPVWAGAGVSAAAIVVTSLLMRQARAVERIELRPAE